MTLGQQGMPTINRFGQTTVYDIKGRVILEVTSRQFTVMEPNGTVSVHEQGDWIQLVDGLMWNPALLAQANPVLLTVCEACRRWPGSSHGCMSLMTCRVCIDCGAGTCARHRRLIGGHWRCLSCARLYRLKRFIRALFFSRE